MTKEKLVICPVYNEEKTIEKFYTSLRKIYHNDLLFIDDGSTDKSRDFLKNIEHNHTFVTRHKARAGYGAALMTGFDFAFKNYYQKSVVIDADLQHDPKNLDSFFEGLALSEVVLGSRYIKLADSLDVPKNRLMINRYIQKLLTVLFGVQISDPFCGYRAYRYSFLAKAYFEEKSYGFGLEIILEMLRTKTSFHEIPIEIVYYDSSRKFLDGLDNPKERLLHYLETIANKKTSIEKELCLK